jgi:predicted DNA-binding transcriptional regulator AlpA
MAKKKAPARGRGVNYASDDTKPAARSLGQQEKHCWEYDDLVKITGKSRNTIYKHVERKSFDPDDLMSVVLWVARHAPVATKRQILDYALDHTASENPAIARRRR